MPILPKQKIITAIFIVTVKQKVTSCSSPHSNWFINTSVLSCFITSEGHSPNHPIWSSYPTTATTYHYVQLGICFCTWFSCFPHPSESSLRARAMFVLSPIAPQCLAQCFTVMQSKHSLEFFFWKHRNKLPTREKLKPTSSKYAKTPYEENTRFP